MLIGAAGSGRNDHLGAHDMAVADLRDAFNSISEPRFTCQRATLAYESRDATQFQRLHFSGTGADNLAFEIQSDLLRPDTDVNMASRAVAQRLLDQPIRL